MPTAPVSTTTFADLGLPEAQVAALEARGIKDPTPVQAAVIPLALTDGDILAQARTGSGKTLAFLLPLATRLAAGELGRAWVVCPTRELAQQAAREADLVLGAGRTAILVGGAPAGPQLKALRAGPALVVGTPGRMIDHLHHGALTPDAGILVLDEADQMLDLGFRDELEELVKDLGEGVARWCFSATFGPAVQEVVSRWLKSPRVVRLDTQVGASHIPQKYVTVPRGQEQAALNRLIAALSPTRALVFVRTRDGVETAVQGLNSAGIEAAGISGELAQDARERVLARFRAGSPSILVGTDVAARGLDVKDISHVFNLGLPGTSETYTHRVGRTGRAGASGEAWSVIAHNEKSRFLMTASRAKCRPEAASVPTPAEIVGVRRAQLATRLSETLGEGFELPAQFKELVDAHGAPKVLAALVHRLVPDSLPEPAAPTGDRNAVSLFVGLGSEDGLVQATLISGLCKAAGIDFGELGRIKLLPRHSLISCSQTAAQALTTHPIHYHGRRVPVRLDQGPTSTGPSYSNAGEGTFVGKKVAGDRPGYAPGKKFERQEKAEQQDVGESRPGIRPAAGYTPYRPDLVDGDQALPKAEGEQKRPYKKPYGNAPAKSPGYQGKGDGAGGGYEAGKGSYTKHPGKGGKYGK